MKVLVTGVGGQLGYDVVKELIARNHYAIGTDINKSVGAEVLDITDAFAARKLILKEMPDAVIHCAGWTAVDAAEDEPDKCFQINVDGTKNLADVCAEMDIKMVYISTDYVFNGNGSSPWSADCKEFGSLNVYGRSKLGGELAVSETVRKFFVVRTAWVFGSNGKNFLKTMLNIGRTHSSVRVVNDQIGTPTYTVDLARLLVDMIETEKYGFYNATNEGGFISWFDLTCELFKQAGYSTEVIPVTTSEYGMNKAIRPFNSRLDKQKLVDCGFAPLPDWRDAVARYLEEIAGEYR